MSPRYHGAILYVYYFCKNLCALRLEQLLEIAMTTAFASLTLVFLIPLSIFCAYKAEVLLSSDGTPIMQGSVSFHTELNETFVYLMLKANRMYLLIAASSLSCGGFGLVRLHIMCDLGNQTGYIVSSFSSSYSYSAH